MAIKTVRAQVNGTWHTLTLNPSTKKYEASITAPTTSSYNQPNHYYNVTVEATNTAGTTVTANGTTLSGLQLVVKEKTAPIITITAPTASSTLTNNKPTITWEVTDADSGVNPSTISIKIDSGSVITSGITKTAAGKGYTCSYVPTTALTDGSHTITVNASDYDGNAATAKSVTFKVDTTPPTLSVSSPAAGLITNTAALTVSGTTNDATSSPVTVKITLNGADQGTVTVASSGAFSKAVTLKEGNNTIVVTATDAVGKASTITRTVTLDTSAPKITAATITPNPADVGATVLISVTITEE